MTREESELVLQRMRQEGFHYCFNHYSTFKEIDDPEFHKLRKAYLQHAKMLESYLEEQLTVDEEDDWEML